MAAEDGSSRRAVALELGEHGPGFEFVQLVRLLQLAAGDRVSVGRGRDPDREAIRFRSRVSFAFPASDVHRVESQGDDAQGQAVVTVNFLGLASPTTRTALPAWYARELLTQARDDPLGPVLRDFLDLFNHRLISFFFRAWERHSLPYHYELLRDGLLHQVLYSLIGLGHPSLRDRLAVDDRVLLRHAGVLVRRPVTPDGLVTVLRSFFGDEVDLEEMIPRRHALDGQEMLRLGGTRFRLGRDTVLGSTVVMTQCHFRLRIGPLDWATMRDYLPPHGQRYAELRDLVRFAVGPEFEFDARLVLRAREVPPLKLGADNGARLGWSTWLGARLTARDADDTLVPVSLLESLP